MAIISLPAGAATFAVTNLNDSGAGSLRQAITDANATPGADTIAFQAGLTGTITLASYLEQITDGLTINGPGANVLAVSGTQVVGTIFYISAAGAAVAISGLTLKDCQTPVYNGNSTLTFTNSTLSGSSVTGIYNRGTLTVANSTLSGNSGAAGIYNGGTLTVTNSTLSGNSANSGVGGIYNAGTLTVANSTLFGNSANSSGGVGGIYNAGTLTLSNTIVAGNTGGPSGGKEIYNSSGTTFTSLGHNLFGENGTSGVTGATLDLGACRT